MNEKDFKLRVNELRKRGLNKSIFVNLALLLLPSFLMIVVFFISLYSFILSLFAIYFILPMFYTVERRICFSLTGIGKADFSYADGYSAFFKEKKGGIFGMIITLLLSFSLLLLSFVVFMNAFPNIVSLYPESLDVFQKIGQMYQNPYQNSTEFFTYVMDNLHYLTRPLTILFSICLFLPMFVALFFSLPSNLSHHYLATIVLPDIDKNISASQARSLSKNSFGRPINGLRIKYNFLYNWPYMIVFTLLYGVSTYLTSLIQTDNSYVTILVILITPALSLLYGLILQYFCILNNYAVMEVLAPNLLTLLPEPMKIYISQAFKNPQYIHGEETSYRGAFVPEVKRYEEKPDMTIDVETKEPNGESVTGFVVDFSDQKEEKDK